MQKLKTLQTSNLLGREFTIYGTVENPLFLARDVAEMIGHSDISTMMRVVDEDEKYRDTNPNNVCGGQSAWFLTEDGFYRFNRGIGNILSKGCGRND